MVGTARRTRRASARTCAVLATLTILAAATLHTSYQHQLSSASLQALWSSEQQHDAPSKEHGVQSRRGNQEEDNPRIHFEGVDNADKTAVEEEDAEITDEVAVEEEDEQQQQQQDDEDAADEGSSDSAGEAKEPLLFFDVGHAYHHQPKCPPGWDMPGFTCDAGPCPVPWDYTNDRQAADAVIYNTLDGMSGWGSGSPAARPGQWVVMFAMESGQYYPSIYTAKQDGANITADYRLDSDVPVTYYTRYELPNLTALEVPFSQKREDGLIAAFISNCGALNNRGTVLNRLIELLPGLVHSYGSCAHNKDVEAGGSQNKRLEKRDMFSRYKFAFTPENSNDPGYVTEKVYHALEAGTVPIYMGAPDIHRLVPVPEAVIRVEDFNSTEALVDYVKAVAADEKLYQKHLDWKQLPPTEWSEDWKALERLTKYSAHCRIAMHMAGRPHKWQAEPGQH